MVSLIAGFVLKENRPSTIYADFSVWRQLGGDALKNNVLKNFAKFFWKHLCRSLFSVQLAQKFIKKKLQQRCFTVIFLKFLRELFCRTSVNRCFSQCELLFTPWKRLTHFSLVFHCFNPWKHQKTFGFSDVFRGYSNTTLDWTGLKQLKE